MLGRALERAAADRLSIAFRAADAEALAFSDESFEIVMSTFEVMFTPDRDRAAAELLRVCKPGGKIGLANWTPDGFIGQLFKTIGQHVPPPVGAKSPALWGTEPRLADLFVHLGASVATGDLQDILRAGVERPLRPFRSRRRRGSSRI
nr:class I SAM-dependent methyltransferase [uncultured Rhodopila sp.]